MNNRDQIVMSMLRYCGRIKQIKTFDFNIQISKKGQLPRRISRLNITVSTALVINITVLKVTPLHGCFSRFLDCTNVLNQSMYKACHMLISFINSLGSPYDYDSIMHYRCSEFPKIPFMTPIRVKAPGVAIGQRGH